MVLKFEILAKEIAPGHVVTDSTGCSGGQCPAVLTCDDGSLIVVGNRLTSSELAALEGGGQVKVYEHEFAIKLNPELIRTAAEKL